MPIKLSPDTVARAATRKRTSDIFMHVGFRGDDHFPAVEERLTAHGHNIVWLDGDDALSALKHAMEDMRDSHAGRVIVAHSVDLMRHCQDNMIGYICVAAAAHGLGDFVNNGIAAALGARGLEPQLFARLGITG